MKDQNENVESKQYSKFYKIVVATDKGNGRSKPYKIKIRGILSPIPNEQSIRDNFVENVAREIYEKLNNSDKACMVTHPDRSYYHFGLGLWIRNNYIHGRDLGFNFYHEADELSGEIINRIMMHLNNEFDNKAREKEEYEE